MVTWLQGNHLFLLTLQWHWLSLCLKSLKHTKNANLLHSPQYSPHLARNRRRTSHLLWRPHSTNTPDFHLGAGSRALVRCCSPRHPKPRQGKENDILFHSYVLIIIKEPHYRKILTSFISQNTYFWTGPSSGDKANNDFYTQVWEVKNWHSLIGKKWRDHHFLQRATILQSREWSSGRTSGWPTQQARGRAVICRTWVWLCTFHHSPLPPQTFNLLWVNQETQRS